MRRLNQLSNYSRIGSVEHSIGHSEIQRGTGASFELQPIDKLIPPYERSC